MEHLSVERLRAVAINEEMLFTLEELNHLRKCNACFEQWHTAVQETAKDRKAE